MGLEEEEPLLGAGILLSIQAKDGTFKTIGEKPLPFLAEVFRYKPAEGARDSLAQGLPEKFSFNIKTTTLVLHGPAEEYTPS